MSLKAVLRAARVAHSGPSELLGADESANGTAARWTFVARGWANMVAVADLIVVTGPPGAGKTTVSRALAGMFLRSALVPGDAFFGFIDRGYLSPWTEQAHRQNEVVVSAAAAAAGRLAAGGYTVVYDGAVSPWFVDDFGQAAGVACLHYVVLLPPEQVCLDRVESRVGHGFNDLEAARRMYAEFADAGIDRRHVVTRSDEAGALAVHLQRMVQARSVVRSVEPRRAGPG